MLTLDPISTEVLKSIVASGFEAGSKIVTRIKKSEQTSKGLKEYIQRITNRVSYFTTYRKEPQHVDNAYVHPLILDSALSQSYFPPETYIKIIATIEYSHHLGLSGEDLSKFIAANIPTTDLPVLQLRYIPLEKLSTDFHHVLVMGEAGAGKSALLSYICLNRLRSKNPRLPLFADARDLENRSIPELINNLLVTLNLTDKDLQWLNKTLSLYIDGLDELSSTRYKEVCLELGNLRREFPDLEILVSCRSAAYHEELTFLNEVSLVPFDFVRAVDFIERWFKADTKGPQPDNLIIQLQKNEKLSELSSQPLLLTLMCNAYRRYLRISRRQTALFDQCLESLLWQWDADRAIVRESSFSSLDLEKKKWLHATLAVNLHIKRERFVDKRLLLSILHEALPRFGIPSSQDSEVLEELCAHHGILVKWTEETYGFGHLALQEYLTAKWYADEQRWKTLITREKLTDAWWENTISMCFAILSDASDAMSVILDYSDMTELEKLKLLSNVLRYDPLISSTIRSSILQRILYIYHNGKAIEHDAAMNMLVGIEDEWSTPIIIRSLNGKLPTHELAKLLQLQRPKQTLS